jgi:hypothetical protein
MQLIFIKILAFVVLPILLLIFVYIIVHNISRQGLKISWRDPDYKINGLCQHLQRIGVGASILGIKWTMGGLGRLIWRPPWYLETIPSTIKLEGNEIDSINVICTSNIGSRYYWYNLDFIVRNSIPHDRIVNSKTRLIIKPSSGSSFLTSIKMWSGKAVDVECEWRGNADLVQELNLDDRLKDRLLNTDLGDLHTLEIVPEPKYGCTRIRTNYFLPTMELFNILETIAKHIKSV